MITEVLQKFTILKGYFDSGWHTNNIFILSVKTFNVCVYIRFAVAGQFRTSSDQRYTVLELPYLRHSLSLLLALPSDRKTTLSTLESQLTPRQVASWDTGLRRTKMDIFLPR